ncbi:MAG: polysaccharide pyruvyl transferase family protein [Saprospiraceae bacterium]|nr:polysaccharide pyruvyl transferase family protein [Saprospiraceae bacterium]
MWKKEIKTFWVDCGNNFGDNLTWYLLWKLFDIRLIQTTPKEARFIGAGSILEYIDNNFNGTIFGTGMMYSNTRKDFTNANVVGLRGKLTLERCKYRGEPVLGDLGLLSHLLCKSREKKYKLGLIPHYVDKDNQQIKEWSKVDGVKYIDVRSGVQNVIDLAAQCDTIVSSSLHGIMLADSLNIPNEWVKLSNKVNGEDFKFRDYYSIFNISPEPKTEISWVVGDYERENVEGIKAELHKKLIELCEII